MPDPQELTPAQAARLRQVLEAGFRFIRIAHVERYVAVEREGFAALLDVSGGQLSIFGQAGVLLGEGIAMLVEQRGRKVFVWKQQSVEATPELLAKYQRFKDELEGLLGGQ